MCLWSTDQPWVLRVPFSTRPWWPRPLSPTHNHSPCLPGAPTGNSPVSPKQRCHPLTPTRLLPSPKGTCTRVSWAASPGPYPGPSPAPNTVHPPLAARPRTLAGQVPLGTALREAVLAQAPSSTGYRPGDRVAALVRGDGRGCPPRRTTTLSQGRGPTHSSLWTNSIYSTLGGTLPEHSRQSWLLLFQKLHVGGNLQGHPGPRATRPGVPLCTVTEAPAHGHLLRFPGWGFSAQTLPGRSL